MSKAYPFGVRGNPRFRNQPGSLKSLTLGDVSQIDQATSGLQVDDISSLPLHLFPPVDWENIDKYAYVALPAAAATATILSFQVPQGRNGKIYKVANNFVGGGWTEGSGAVIWSILVDGAAIPGANDYASILGSLGSPASPTEISGFRIYENQTVTVVVKNVSVVVAGQVSGSRLIGYLYPRESEDSSAWI